MKLIRYGIIGLVIFSILLNIFIGISNQISNDYSIPETYYTINNSVRNESIGEALAEINFQSGFNYFTNLFKSEGSSATDILGSLALQGIGETIKIITGIFSTPFEIAAILISYWNIPSELIMGVVTIMLVYLIFIIISANTRGQL